MKTHQSFVLLMTSLLAIPVLSAQQGIHQVPESDGMAFPNENWELVPPSNEGVDEEKMLEALTYLESKCFSDGIGEVIILRNGRAIYMGPHVDRSHNIWSCSKSFTSTVLGLLIEEGKCSLQSTAWSWESSLSLQYKGVTLRHFTTMTSGYDAVGATRWDGDSEDWSWTPYEPAPPQYKPGQAFAYWDEAMMMFGRCLTLIAGESLKEVFERRIGSRIGLGDWEWHGEGEVDGLEINNGCTGISLNAKQFARFGHLFLNMGTWDGDQLISRGWVREATRAQVPESLPVASTDRANVKGSGSYGYNWWVNGGLTALPDAPDGTYYASGLNHNVCFIVPEWNMVFVRMGTDGNPPEGKHVVWNEFLRKFAMALSENQ